MNLTGMLHCLQAYTLQISSCSCTQVIAVLLDNWKLTGGVDEYVAWTNRASAKHADFFTDAEMKNWCGACRPDRCSLLQCLVQMQNAGTACLISLDSMLTIYIVRPALLE